VDWKADVFVNDKLAGSHSGGYTPFSFDITPHLAKQGANKLVVRVWDPTDTHDYPRGKQVSNPNSIWYTSVTGIWQTVWLEPVAPNHITGIKAIPDIDKGVLAVTVSTTQTNAAAVVRANLLDKGGRVVATAKGAPGDALALKVANPLLWDTQTPNLYDLNIALSDASGKTIDDVQSYAAFRKISKVRGADGVNRLQLNNKTLFQFGPLDQGWWPDGLYTAPTDAALLYDIKKTKDFGFNMIRKHVKVEPARWYYHCDREGMLVWQDMPSTGGNGRWDKGRGRWNAGRDHGRIPTSAENFLREWGEIIDLCISHPSVVVWVPFNEGWGQWNTQKIAEWTAKRDPSRLVNSASGGNYRKCGDILDIHHYPNPTFSGEPPFLAEAKRDYVVVLGEYGGIGRPVDGHLWWNKRNWGYVQFKTEQAVTAEYVKYTQQLKPLVKQVYAGAIYTQTTDVEGEVNGLITYDRKVIKLNEAQVRKANQEVINGQ
jgi:beta-galactosidase/beta-glucuronidase